MLRELPTSTSKELATLLCKEIESLRMLIVLTTSRQSRHQITSQHLLEREPCQIMLELFKSQRRSLISQSLYMVSQWNTTKLSTVQKKRSSQDLVLRELKKIREDHMIEILIHSSNSEIHLCLNQRNRQKLMKLRKKLRRVCTQNRH